MHAVSARAESLSFFGCGGSSDGSSDGSSGGSREGYVAPSGCRRVIALFWWLWLSSMHGTIAAALSLRGAVTCCTCVLCSLPRAWCRRQAVSGCQRGGRWRRRPADKQGRTAEPAVQQWGCSQGRNDEPCVRELNDEPCVRELNDEPCVRERNEKLA